ncbi:hypothetical protein E4L96_10310 [Massilia arenosa]|uniref:Uncharacterized protein n=2 Tax=Zemynaea arenosa TaxID=2561931 RepID=A0A4Y9SIJ6_9BURK|nr:hypothetical protein E4L96_10310 [Massilia arenosa]
MQMLGEAAKARAEAALLAQLNALLPGTGWNRASLDAATNQVKVYLDGQGVHTLTGITHPFYELMLWTQEERKDYTVQLPEHTVQVPVVLMGGFLSRGWLSYASCERTGAGGWTANGVLYALADNYDLEGEKFKVTFLGHEGQHFADNRDFPKLEESELEYRAKLTELALASDPAALLDKFRTSAQRGRRVPHAHAEYFVGENMRTQLAGVAAPDRARLQAAARALLAASSSQARAAGAATVVRLLPD